MLSFGPVFQNAQANEFVDEAGSWPSKLMIQLDGKGQGVVREFGSNGEREGGEGKREEGKGTCALAHN